MRCRTLIDGCFSQREVSPAFDRQYDVIVVGLGTAGAVAAITAGELGLKTWGVERLNGMGGTGTMGSVLDYYYGQPGGMLEKVNADCDALMATGHYVTSQREELTGQGRKSYPGLVKSYAMEQRALNSGVALSYGTTPIGVYLEGDRIAGLRCLSEGRIIDAAASVIIDATGEAEVAYLAGCPMQEGRLTDHACAYFSKSWTLYKEEDYVMGLWLGNGRIDAADAAAFAEANLRAMRASPRLVGAQQFPASRAVYESPMLCMREGRKAETREMLTLKKYLAGERTRQPVFFAASHVDTFSQDMALEDEIMQDYEHICNLRPFRITMPVPMGALIAKKVEGVLIAGRCMGVDHNISGGVRMKMDMEKAGESAATLAFAALKDGVSPSHVAYDKVAARLRQTGCLDDSQDQPWKEDFWHGETLLHWPDSEEKLLEMLSNADICRTALWSARQEPSRWQSALLQGLQAENPLLAANCALALGMAKHPAALPALRDMARNEADLPLAAKAICLLGRYALAQDAQLLLDLARRPLPGKDWGNHAADRRVYVFLEAEMALLRIIRSHPDAEKYAQALRAIVFAPDFLAFLSNGEVDMTQTMRRLALD